jgi:NitT/TauT family transport system ATP-binding protein
MKNKNGKKTKKTRLDIAPLIRVSGVQKIYSSKKGEAVKALEEVSFDARDGEFLSIVGPSGCGKSTLLMGIAGVLPLTKGEIILKGKPVKGPQADMGVVFQKSVLFNWRTIIKNVMLTAEILGLDKKEYNKKAMDLIKLFGLEGFEDKYPMELSGGMQQRASICRALLHDPSLLLMDEPFGALDALTRDKMNLWLQKVWSEKKKTIIFVTHYVPEAVFLSDRVVVLSPRPGRVGKVVEINLPRPRTWGMRTSPEYGKYIKKILDYMGEFEPTP